MHFQRFYIDIDVLLTDFQVQSTLPLTSTPRVTSTVIKGGRFEKRLIPLVQGKCGMIASTEYHP